MILSNGHDTGLDYRKPKEPTEVIAIYSGDDDFHVGDIGVLLGSLYHTRGKWKGQFFVYHVQFGTRQFCVTEEDVQILPSKSSKSTQ